ncbi:MerR family transcriptional regulator [Eggerthella sinensis]|uniref:MerR family transcriptional regulator n=1 Tax=Eggerthella sinensis TaxID=242230 RepID=UPI00266D08C0|nr:MerR family transcriptional regulator [Eggerthella sinensis]
MPETMSIKAYFESSDAKRDSAVGIGDMAKHMGITAQGLHWYESRGLISPQKVNTYRKYTTKDLCILSRIRFYRQIGFSSSEIDELLDTDIDAIGSALDERIVHIRRNMEKQQVKLSIIEERARLAHDFKEREGVFVPVETEAFYFKHSFKVLQRGEKHPVSTVKDWVDDMPLAQYVSIAGIRKGPDRGVDKVGLALPEKYYPYASEAVKDEIAHGAVPLMASQKALYGLVKIDDMNGSGPIAFIDDIVETEASRLEGVMLMRPISCCRADDSVVAFWEVWLPLKSEL